MKLDEGVSGDGFVELDDPLQRHPLVQGRLANGQGLVRHCAAAAAADTQGLTLALVSAQEHM